MTNDMIQLLVNTDQNLLLYLNGFHNAFGDYFMSTFTGKWIWVIKMEELTLLQKK